MTGQEKGDCLIEVATWAGLTVLTYDIHIEEICIGSYKFQI